MEKDIVSYLEKDYRYLSNYLKDFNDALFKSPHSAIIKGRMFAENLSKEISRLENYGLMSNMTQLERLKKLSDDEIIDTEIGGIFHSIRKLGNQAAHSSVEGELEVALNMHRNIYKITCWFVGVYIDFNFEANPYKTPPIPNSNSDNINSSKISELMKKIEQMENMIVQVRGNSTSENDENEEINDDSQDVFENLLIESIIDDTEVTRNCLVHELSRLKESSKEAVEGLGEFTPFKKYMHIEREAQKELEDLILNAHKSNKAQLILVCGSVGDGKSHIISYFKNNYKDIMKGFTLHNDATESLEPNKTSMDTLNEVLDSFSDEKINTSSEKLILAINLGTLNNFIDSKYQDRFSILKKYVYDKKILETRIEDNNYDGESSIQFVNFGDYHIFTLKDGKVESKYIKSLITKIADFSEFNIFYNSYKKNCKICDNKNYCPIKSNYELLSSEQVQEGILDLLVRSIITKKIIVSTRALLNFMYELIVPRLYIDVNSLTLKKDISKMNGSDYIKSLMPNMIFNHKELSFIFEALNSLDPLNIRNQQVDDFIIEFNNASDTYMYFKEYIDFPEGYIDKTSKVKFGETQDQNMRTELLKLFIRGYYLCGKGDVFCLKDKVYESYMRDMYYWNKGDKSKLKELYDNVKSGILKWNGEAEKNQVNIFLGKNQIKYKVSEYIELKADVSNLIKSSDIDLKKFITTLDLKYKSEKENESYLVNIDYSLYKLLREVIEGYRPNKIDKNYFISFIDFINKLQESGSQNEKLIFTEKNRDINKKYRLEYDSEFEVYRFVEI